jgi:hypothetical protein
MRLTSRMGWFSGMRALTSTIATNCRRACFLPRMTAFTGAGPLIPDLFPVFHQLASNQPCPASKAISESAFRAASPINPIPTTAPASFLYHIPRLDWG